MTTLRASPYSLAYDTLVTAKIKAQNSIGWSDLGAANTLTSGAKIQTEPTQMAVPTRNSGTSAS